QLGLRSLIRVFLSGGPGHVNRRQRTPPPALESVSPRAAALPVQCARRRTAPAAATASLSLYKLRANRQHGNKVPANQSDKSSNRIPAARSGGQICPPESSVQKLCAVQNQRSVSWKIRRASRFARDHFNSSAAVTTDCATSAIFLLSFIAVLRSSA